MENKPEYVWYCMDLRIAWGNSQILLKLRSVIYRWKQFYCSLFLMYTNLDFIPIGWNYVSCIGDWQPNVTIRYNTRTYSFHTNCYSFSLVLIFYELRSSCVQYCVDQPLISICHALPIRCCNIENCIRWQCIEAYGTGCCSAVIIPMM